MSRHVIQWHEATAAEREAVTTKLLGHTLNAVRNAEQYQHVLPTKPRALANLKRNLRLAQVRYSAVCRLSPGVYYPDIETRIKNLVSYVEERTR